MTINKNPIISFTKNEYNLVADAYKWFFDMDGDDFYTLGEMVKKEYPNFDIDRLFNLLDDLIDFMEDRIE